MVGQSASLELEQRDVGRVLVAALAGEFHRPSLRKLDIEL